MSESVLIPDAICIPSRGMGYPRLDARFDTCNDARRCAEEAEIVRETAVKGGIVGETADRTHRVPDSVYIELAAAIVEGFDSDETCWQGEVECTHSGFVYAFSGDLWIYRTRVELPEGVVYPIKRLVPCWAECHVWREDDPDNELPSDFRFNNLNYYLPGI